MTGEVRHAACELRFRKPIVTAKGELEKRRGFLFGLDLGEKKFVSEASLLPEFGTEYFEHAERILQMETANVGSAPATLFGLDCIRWASERRRTETISIPVAKLLRTGSDSQVLDSAKRARDDGFTSMKLKVGIQETSEDARLVRAIYKEVPELGLRLDANCGWNGKKFLKFKRMVPGEMVEWFEDPCDSDEWISSTEGIDFPVACDEAFSHTQLKQDSTWKKFDVLVVKPERFGPIAELEQICARGRIEGKKVVFSSMYASGVGLAHIATLAHEYGSPDVAHGLGTSGVFEEDTLCEPLMIREGKLVVPPLDELVSLLRPEWRGRLGFSAA